MRSCSDCATHVPVQAQDGVEGPVGGRVPVPAQLAVPVADQPRLPPLARSAATPVLIAVAVTVPEY
jgi:hypothetical protein